VSIFSRWFGRARNTTAPVVGLTGDDARRAATLAVAKLPRNGKRCKPGEFRRITDDAIRQAATGRKGRK
jgi:hypothetical protein